MQNRLLWTLIVLSAASTCISNGMATCQASEATVQADQFKYFLSKVKIGCTVAQTLMRPSGLTCINRLFSSAASYMIGEQVDLLDAQYMTRFWQDEKYTHYAIERFKQSECIQHARATLEQFYKQFEPSQRTRRNLIEAIHKYTLKQLGDTVAANASKETVCNKLHEINTTHQYVVTDEVYLAIIVHGLIVQYLYDQQHAVTFSSSNK